MTDSMIDDVDVITIAGGKVTYNSPLERRQRRTPAQTTALMISASTMQPFARTTTNIDSMKSSGKNSYKRRKQPYTNESSSQNSNKPSLHRYAARARLARILRTTPL